MDTLRWNYSTHKSVSGTKERERFVERIMKKIISLLSAGVLAISMAVPVAAQGMGQDQMISQGLARPADRGFRVVRDGHNRQWRGNHRGNRGFYKRGGYGWYNGHRGYRTYRRGYRQYNGWWFPTAILGGAIMATPLRMRRVGAVRMSSGATTTTVRIAPRTIPTSPITARAANACRPTEARQSGIMKRRAPAPAGAFH
jgi:hypothetical protein